VADGWCWFGMREKYCWLVGDGWFILREKHCWLVADKLNEQGDNLLILLSLNWEVCVPFFILFILCSPDKLVLSQWYIIE
jgi:hypothetical protein